jgi:signal transduction histidine kinase
MAAIPFNYCLFYSMQEPSMPLNENERMAAFRQSHIPESGVGQGFDELTRLASEICQTPISLITLTNEERQRFMTDVDLPVIELSREIALCSDAFIHPYDSLVIPDLRKDKRFSDHPSVTGKSHVVFYAAIRLTNPDGHSLGTLCVIDKKPKTLPENKLRSLKYIANQVIQLLELCKANFRLKSLKEDLAFRNEELQQFAYVVSHDIKSPLSSIVLSSEMLRENFGENINEENDQLLNVLNRASLKIKNLVDGILAYYRAEQAMQEEPESFLLKPFLLSVVEILKVNQNADIRYPQQEAQILANKTALEQILVNLLQNALKYNDKEKPQVFIRFSEDSSNYYFVVTDNGNGISAIEQEKIFECLNVTGERDRFGITGSGNGLSTVKKLVEKMSGKMTVNSVPGQGSDFSFFIKKVV